MKNTLICILLLQGITAIIGGAELIRTDGMGMPIDWLRNSPFNSFLLPGLILMLVVGGTSLTAAIFLINNHRYQYESSVIAGFGILIWIFVQIYMIREVSFLQAVYVSSGITILVLSILIRRSRITK